MSEKTKFDEWALVELMGRQRIVGRVSEATLAGGAFLRVDVPEAASQPGFTRYFTPQALYGISPMSENAARALLQSIRPEPVQPWELPQIAEKVPGGATFTEDDEDEL